MDIKDVENLANLARIELGEDEKKEALSDMRGILEYVKVIEKIEVPTNTNTQEYNLKNVWREDLSTSREFSKELIIEQFPAKKDNFLKVKKIL